MKTDPSFRIGLAVCKFLLSILLLLCMHAKVVAQTGEFIESISKSRLSIKSVEYESKTRANDLVKKIDYVKIGSLKNSQKGGNLTFSLPGYSNKIHAKATYVNYIDENTNEWRGETNNGLGSVILICEEGKVAGHISLPDAIFGIYPFPDGDHIVTTINTREKEIYHCGIEETSLIASDEFNRSTIDEENARLNPCPAVRPVRVLFLVTPEARAIDPSLNNTVNLCVSQFNSSITRSAISSGAAIESAGIVDFPFLTSDRPQDDARLLAADVAAKAHRDAYQADVVVLFTNAGWNTVYGIVPKVGPDNGNAYALVEINRALSHKTFVHEVGHLYGGKHHNDSSDPSWARGYRKRNWLGLNTKWRTVMYGDASTDTQLNFSNPSVSISGDPTGTSSNNNAARLGETYATVRAFRSDPPRPFIAYVTGPTEVFTFGSRTYEAVYSCGAAPYSFNWSVSTDGISYTPVSSTSETYTHWFYSPSTIHWIYIRVTVRDGSGAQAISTFPVYVSLPSSFSIQMLADEKAKPGSGQEENAESELVLYPNPSGHTTSVMYTLPVEGNVEIDLIDNQGIVVKTLRVENEKTGEYTATLHLDGVRPGLYQVILKMNNVIRTKRLLVRN